MPNQDKDKNQTRRPKHQDSSAQRQNPGQQQRQQGERKDQGGQAGQSGQMDEGRRERGDR
jgi:hypothetical protein